jgi:hypothetical protein
MNYAVNFESGSGSKTTREYENNISYNITTINNNHDGTNIDSITPSTIITKNNSNDNDKCNRKCPDINVNIYRYKFTEDFTNELYKFSKIHQYDHRKDFKEAWSKWVEEQDDIVNTEIRRLTNLGYDGDILDKMFKSARYYFRKKSTEKKEPAKRRDYKGLNKDLLAAMDNHLKSNINEAEFKPSMGFDAFCKENVDLLQEEVTQLCRCGFTDATEIKNKIKKTYKNRYFILISR